MRYWWSFLFGITALLITGASLYAPHNSEWWLPNNVSTLGRDVDRLFMLVVWITGAVFVGTMLAIVWVTWRGVPRPGKHAVYFHGSQKLELIWTLIPAVILVYITWAQMGTWADIKFNSRKPSVSPLAEVTGRQFQWVMRYPGPDGKLNTVDDLHLINDLHFVKNTPVLIQLKSADVIHSFFLPRMRIKQDAVPGLSIPVWFDSAESGRFELVCAELCGWGHYKMKGLVTVHDTQDDFDAWMKSALAKQSADRPSQVLAVAAIPAGER